MNQNDVRLVQSTRQTVANITPEAAARFYQNLFEADASLKQPFKSDIRAQGQKLMQMIGAAVGKLDDCITKLCSISIKRFPS